MKHFNHLETVILVGGSKVKLNTLKAISNQHSVYAADSGANILIDEQINFESVIGDMDSIDSKILSNDVGKILERCWNDVLVPTLPKLHNLMQSSHVKRLETHV